MAVEERNLIAPGAGLTAAPPVVGRFSDFVYQLRGNPAKIEIAWPSGARQIVEDVAANQFLEIREP